MSEIPWNAILSAAEAAAPYAPPPFNIVAKLALVIAKGFISEGCTVEGCPTGVRAQLKLMPGDVPTGEKGLSNRAKAKARATGTDARGIADRKGGK